MARFGRLMLAFVGGGYVCRMMALVTGIGVVVVAAAVLSAVPARQGQTFQASADLVALYVTVTDERGRPVRGLSKEDFTLFDQGRQQQIAVFSHEPQPARHPRPARLQRQHAAAQTRHIPGRRRGACRPLAARRSGESGRVQLRRAQPVVAHAARSAGLHAAIARNSSRRFAGRPRPLAMASRRSGALSIAALDALADESVRRVLVLLSDGHDTDAHGYKKSLIDKTGQVEVSTPGGPSTQPIQRLYFRRSIVYCSVSRTPSVLHVRPGVLQAARQSVTAADGNARREHAGHHRHPR